MTESDHATRCICVHGHFYQPPRENPWLERIQAQESARPFHDWNERVTAECYAPNASARILDRDGWIRAIVNNYARLSFDFGPTLLSWLEMHAPRAYGLILEADRLGCERAAGHGPALAQAYNHMILPLATARDRRTQVRWGLADFAHRFARPAEGMWLPETAVDVATLELLAEHDVRFTILAPSQASRVREVGRAWRAVGGAGIDPRRPYFIQLPSGRSITVFFYDGALASAVAFGGLLRDGRAFADRLVAGLDGRADPQLVAIATDGETYGHHHPHGDMALAYALDDIARRGRARLVSFAEYVAEHPAVDEVEIRENTAWSCAHGVDRWRADCGCRSGGQAGWSQAWRAPLRRALDLVRDAVVSPYEAACGRLMRDPWRARDAYIEVVLDRGGAAQNRFFEAHAAGPLTVGQKVEVLRLLELQRNAMLMYTSCGWFFDDLAGLETVQILMYAGRVIQLAEECFGTPFEGAFLDALAAASSNRAEVGDGRRLYEARVRPARVNLATVAAHYGVSSLFRAYAEREQVYCYDVVREEHREHVTGRARLCHGRVRVTSRVTGESARMSYGVFHLGDHNLSAGVRPDDGLESSEASNGELVTGFLRGDVAEVIRSLDRTFGGSTYSLRSLFPDEQEEILSSLLRGSLDDVEATYRRLYDRHASLMAFCAELATPLPAAFRPAVEFLLNADLRRALGEIELDGDRIRRYLETARAADVRLDHGFLAFTLRRNLDGQMRALVAAPDDRPAIGRLTRAVQIAAALSFEVDLWQVQNGFYRLHAARAAPAGGAAPPDVDELRALGEALRMRLA